jgi:NADPH:quinone reductase-like Zn-dependent oxidoreductase
LRALRLVAFGDPPTFALSEEPDPAPAAGEVVVDLRAAALNRRDPWVWTTPDYCPLPVTLGSDGAGVVSAVGEGVDGLRPGEDVVINPTLGWPAEEDVPGPSFDILGAPLDGTFAERVVVPAENVARMPERLSYAEAAALSLGGLTAWRAAVSCAGAGPGRSVLVTGAGGGVSTFAIQIAAALGAQVWVTTSSEAKLERARRLGAAGGVLYGDAGWPERLRAAAGGGVDAAIDSYGGPTWPGALRALRDGGTLVSYGDTGAAEATVELMEVYWHWRSIVGTTMGSPREYAALLAHVREASWRPVIDSTFPLERFGDAVARFEQAPDRFGKVVLEI